MFLETFKSFNDFELLDTGRGFRLERWGKTILQRPDPQIIWERSLGNEDWDKADAIFKSASGEEKGRWDIKKPIPNPWILTFNDTKFLLKLSPFKHTGLFAEQAAQWEWMQNKLKVESYKVIKGKQPSTLNFQLDNFSLPNKFKVLNLFGYTGAATMVLAKAGCFVTHVDASKPAIAWAKENQVLNKLPTDSVRWILDDAAKFVKREIKRGAKYDGIIMDPPAFGHSPSGKTWKFNDDLPELLHDCATLLSEDAKFLVLNAYATNSSALSINNIMEDALSNRGGRFEFGELCLIQKRPEPGRMISTGIFARWNF